MNTNRMPTMLYHGGVRYASERSELPELRGTDCLGGKLMADEKLSERMREAIALGSLEDAPRTLLADFEALGWANEVAKLEQALAEAQAKIVRLEGVTVMKATDLQRKIEVLEEKRDQAIRERDEARLERDDYFEGTRQLRVALANAEAQRDALAGALKGANELLQAWGDWVNNFDVVEEHAEECGVSEQRVAEVFDMVREALAQLNQPAPAAEREKPCE